MDENRNEPQDEGAGGHPIGYAPRTIRPVHLITRLIVGGVFAAGAALSFEAALSFYVELVTRPAVPSSMMPLYGPAGGCVAFAVGLVLSLIKSRQERAWDFRLALCFAVGVAATTSGVLWPYVWE